MGDRGCWRLGQNWDPGQDSADSMLPQRQALDSLFKAKKSFAKSSCGALVVILHLAPKLPSLSDPVLMFMESVNDTQLYNTY